MISIFSNTLKVSIIDRIINPQVIAYVGKIEGSLVVINPSSILHRGSPVYHLRGSQICNCVLESVGKYFKKFYNLSSVYVEVSDLGLFRIDSKYKTPRIDLKTKDAKLKKFSENFLKCEFEKYCEVVDEVKKAELRKKYNNK